MDIIFFQAIFLGIIEGITEFLPVSSTGHLILSIDIFKLSSFQGQIFEIVIQLGAILAVCWVYKYQVFRIIRGVFRKEDRKTTINLFISFLPIAIAGFTFYSFIKKSLFSSYIVSFSLIIGGIIMLLIEYKKPLIRYTAIEEISWKSALKIGLAQVFAIIPGVSRAAATIIGALLTGADRKAATEYSFLLAVPTIFSASIYDIYKNYHLLNHHNISLALIGFISAFFSALLVIKLFLSFITKHGFSIFAYYRIIIGILILISIS